MEDKKKQAKGRSTCSTILFPQVKVWVRVGLGVWWERPTQKYRELISLKERIIVDPP